MNKSVLTQTNSICTKTLLKKYNRITNDPGYMRMYNNIITVYSYKKNHKHI